MSSQLTFVDCTVELLGRDSVRAFDCGDEIYEREISDWLKTAVGQLGAADEILAGNRVWLAVTQATEFVGIAAIGPSTASWPKNSSPRQQATCVTWVAVDRRHRGKGYGGQIMNHVLGECVARAADFPLVVLYVHQQNPARGWYTAKYQFQPVGRPKQLPNGLYDRLVLSLV